MRDNEIPESNGKDQQEPTQPTPPSEAEDLPDDAAEGDALEQERPGPGDAKPETPREDVPEADALEQGRREDPDAEGPGMPAPDEED